MDLLIPSCIARSKAISKAHMVVVGIILMDEREGGSSVRTQTEMASMSGVSRKTINKAVSELVEMGLVNASSKGKGGMLSLTINHQAMNSF